MDQAIALLDNGAGLAATLPANNQPTDAQGPLDNGNLTATEGGREGRKRKSREASWASRLSSLVGETGFEDDKGLNSNMATSHGFRAFANETKPFIAFNLSAPVGSSRLELPPVGETGGRRKS